jgi:hypothetical protein
MMLNLLTTEKRFGMVVLNLVVKAMLMKLLFTLLINDNAKIEPAIYFARADCSKIIELAKNNFDLTCV